MTFRQFAFNNVTRNKRLYAAYFLSSMFMVMVFFTFAIFAFHPVLNDTNVNGNALYGLKIAYWIIYVFSFFFVLYSMSSFLQSRKKEFGLMMMLGMSARQFRLMVFFENILVGFFATIGGIAVGFLFSRLILLIAGKFLILGSELSFYVPLKAMLLTFVSFMILFLIISFAVAIVLRSGKLLNLIKGNKKSKGEPKASVLLTILAIILIGSGYYLSLISKGDTVITVMLPVIVIVIVGTYLLFTQLSVYLIGGLKKRDSIFWRKTNMILLSDLAFRMKDNARTFFMVAIISTIAFTAIGTMFGLKTATTAVLKSNPYSITYNSNFDKGEVTNTDAEDQDINIINDTLSSNQIKSEQARAVFSYYRTSGQEMIIIVKQSDYNRLAGLSGSKLLDLQEGQSVVVVLDGPGKKPETSQLKQPVVLKAGMTLQSSTIVESKVIQNGTYYVVTDETYDKLPSPDEHRSFYAWKAKNQEQALVHAGEILSEKLPKKVAVYHLFMVDYQVYLTNKLYALVLFIGLFIGIVFFVSAGSFLYFRLYMDLDEDKQKFKSIAKMGLNDQELNKILSRQIGILFFAPIIVALLHGAVALAALSNFFRYSVFTQSVELLGIFFVIQCLYFLLVRFYYIKQIRASI